MGLRERLRRLERETERANAPTPEEYWAAASRETARNLAGVFRKLAALGGNPSAERTRGPEGDTPERAEEDRRTVEAWERAHGKADIRSRAAHAEQARARILDMRPR